MEGRSFDRRALVIDVGTGALIFSLIMLRCCAFGARYWPQLDDYIQYYKYACSAEPFKLVLDDGLLAARPLAGLADIFVWSPLFENMILGVAVITAMYAASAVILRRIFSRYFTVTVIFDVIMALAPLAIEGTYWMSASTRIVTSLFFSSLSALFFLRMVDGKGRVPVNAAIYALFQLVSYGFYEQGLIFSLFLNIILAVLEHREHGLRCAAALWGLFGVFVYFAFTSRFAAQSPVYASRLKPVSPLSADYLSVYLPSALRQMKCVFIDGGRLTLFRGFARGLRLISERSGAGFFAAAAGLCLALYLLSSRSGYRALRKIWKGVAVGGVLSAAPLAPFFVCSSCWFSLRGAVIPLVGTALCIDCLASGLLLRRRFGAKAVCALAACAAFVFSVAGASDISDYKDTFAYDARAVSALLSGFDGRDVAGKNVAILNLSPSYLPEQNYYYHEHIHGVTESPWALYGAAYYYLRSAGGDPASELPSSITPLPDEPVYGVWNAEKSRPENFDLLFLYDPDAAEIYPVTAIRCDDERRYSLILEDGRCAATLYEDEYLTGHLTLLP